MGGDAFRDELMDRIDGIMPGKQRISFSGQQVQGDDVFDHIKNIIS